MCILVLRLGLSICLRGLHVGFLADASSPHSSTLGSPSPLCRISHRVGSAETARMDAHGRGEVAPGAF